MDLTKEQEVELRATIAALFYLSKEAEAIGLEVIAKTILKMINELDLTLKEEDIKLSEMIIQNDLLPLLDFMYKYSNEEKCQLITDLVMQKEKFKEQQSGKRGLLN
jgi:hypothetical protein